VQRSERCTVSVYPTDTLSHHNGWQEQRHITDESDDLDDSRPVKMRA
jgi:hypothetical protein